ncbi:MAG TPA: dihydrodipicolinate synthase family protein [Verrucomicrobiales bacterium]|nr:dihydrodipicolinate synthase family protein [Verrucomicrobiales bacterium]
MIDSVIAVPPLARDESGRVCPEQNKLIIRHIEAGGIRVLLYGGNAVFYHLRMTEYAGVLALLAETAAKGTEIVPSAGPSYGLSMDQAEVLKDLPFRTAMALPHQGLNTPDGVATGLRHFADAFGKPIVVYIKADGYLTPALAAALVKDGIVSWIKYAIVRPDETSDPFLTELTQLVDPSMIVSGMGEQPVIHHLRDRRLSGFTTGCGCIAPRLSAAILEACRAGNWEEAERIRRIFEPLENLRNEINPVRVLHEAVSLAGIGETGTITPLLSPLIASQRSRVEEAARALLAAQV